MPERKDDGPVAGGAGAEPDTLSPGGGFFSVIERKVTGNPLSLLLIVAAFLIVETLLRYSGDLKVQAVIDTLTWRK